MYMVLILEIVPLFLLSSVKSKKMGSVRLSGKKVKRDFFLLLIRKSNREDLQDFPKGYNLYNVGYGMTYSLNQVADNLARLLGKKIKIQFSNRPFWIFQKREPIS